MAARSTRRSTRTPRSRSRALSQNFLADRATAHRFARLAVPDPGDAPILLEVGAGKGALTGPLARRAPAVVAYEIDGRLVDGLRERFAGEGHVRVRHADFLGVRPPRTPFAVAGNVPFSRTSAVVDWCLRADRLTAATFLTQLEYARKRTGDYGSWTRLTVLTWPHVEWRLLGRVARTAFRPAPRVDAGVLRIERREAPLVPPAAYSSYRRLVELGFTGVGGSLRASLGREHSRRAVDRALRVARVAPNALVGEVAPAQWLTLHEVLRA
ncbi:MULTISPECIES: ErmE/ErmH/ErmO/ErmR family 23S rRNA (adenine(2058)-N(6))-methyltransferase [unclassified Streptomyces]|uniref:ErmE/ErmH/ErmO/ErmR family 23S rRNA (adenine(2058)-N(6))-methyltransferase n=1 Tax=unclassified Streptomyces TaxID=2593676 RepID=UPI00278C0A2C|nr:MULTISPECIES: ErmE/ErmH/ErmO/ErmR family 23S rRNA (adenine(2058)-N(6))-methyltransferase [unclassified Streptomyces]